MLSDTLNDVCIFAETEQDFQQLQGLLKDHACAASVARLNMKDLQQSLQGLDAGCVVLVTSAETDTIFPVMQALQGCSQLAIIVFCEGVSHQRAATLVRAGAHSVQAEGPTLERMIRACSLGRTRHQAEQARQMEIGALQQQIHEQALIDRAKRSLMREKRLNEERAHQFLRRLAMEQQVSLVVAAEQVLRYSTRIQASL